MALFVYLAEYSLWVRVAVPGCPQSKRHVCLDVLWLLDYK
jgi:hypothetical protein